MIGAGALADGSVVAGRYRIETRLGAGRTAVVYKAIDLHTRVPVALKVLDPLLLRDPVAVERFRRETDVLRQLNHPHIVKLYDIVPEPRPALCMEYVDGLDAKTYLARHGAMTIAELLPIASALAAALGACHRSRVLHRDLKPHNVLIDRHGQARLVDFGVAKLAASSELTETGALLGTPEYMAPELFRSSHADQRADIYSLGAVLYELLAQRPPHVATSVAGLLACHREVPVTPLTHLRPDVPAWLDRIVRRCLAVDPADRYQSADALQRALTRGAAAAVEVESARIACPHCQAHTPAELPFCGQCGEWLGVAWEAGPYAVVLAQADDLTRVQTRIERFLGLTADSLRDRMHRPPAVLCAGLSRAAADALVTQLAPARCTLQVTRRPSARLDVPAVYAGLAVVLLLPLFWYAAALPMAVNLGMVAGTEATLIACYRHRRRPLLRRRDLEHRPAPRRDAALLRLREAVRALRDPALRAILLRTSSALVRVAPRLEEALPSLEAGSLSDVAQRAAALAGAIESYEVYLAGSDPQALRGRLAALAWQIERERDAEALAPLLAARESARRDSYVHAAIDDAHARAYAALLDVPSLLEKIEDCAGRRDDLGAALRELDDVAGSLHTPPLTALRAAAEG